MIEKMYLEASSCRSYTKEGFSTLKSLVTEQPPGMNIFKEGSSAGSSVATPGSDFLRTTTLGAVSSTSVVGREEEETSFWGTNLEVLAIVIWKSLEKMEKG